MAKVKPGERILVNGIWYKAGMELPEKNKKPSLEDKKAAADKPETAKEILKNEDKSEKSDKIKPTKPIDGKESKKL